jgi:hypothetical protein
MLMRRLQKSLSNWLYCTAEIIMKPKGKIPEDTSRKENETGQLVQELRLLSTEWKS